MKKAKTAVNKQKKNKKKKKRKKKEEKKTLNHQDRKKESTNEKKPKEGAGADKHFTSTRKKSLLIRNKALKFWVYPDQFCRG